MVTHTADCLDCHFRVNKYPAKDWPENSMRNTYEYKNNYPSNIAEDRGETWHPTNLEGTPAQLKAWGTKSVTTGQIPQVSVCVMLNACLSNDYDFTHEIADEGES